jgi:hypothetical protein
MKKVLILWALAAGLFLALGAQAFAQSGVSTVIRYGPTLPVGAPQWSIFSLTNNTGIFQCTNAPICSSSGQWVSIGVSGGIASINTAAGSGLSGGGSSGSLNLSLQACGANQILQYIASAWTCSSAGVGTLTGITAGAGLSGGGTSGTPTVALANPLPVAGTVSSFDGTATAGLGVPAIYGVANATAQAASQSSNNILASPPRAGSYRINYYVNQNGLCATGSDTVFLTFTWSDAANARSAQTIPLTLATAQSPGAGSLQGAVPIYSAISSPIAYSSTLTGSCSGATFDVHISVEETQ